MLKNPMYSNFKCFYFVSLGMSDEASDFWTLLLHRMFNHSSNGTPFYTSLFLIKFTSFELWITDIFQYLLIVMHFLGNTQFGIYLALQYTFSCFSIKIKLFENKIILCRSRHGQVSGSGLWQTNLTHNRAHYDLN